MVRNNFLASHLIHDSAGKVTSLFIKSKGPALGSTRSDAFHNLSVLPLFGYVNIPLLLFTSWEQCFHKTTIHLLVKNNDT